MSEIIIAIDGPAGSGKSSVSKAVARNLDYGYLDTGAAYRALAWLMATGLPVSKLETPEFAKDFDYEISTNPDDFWVRVNGVDVTDEIRSSRISEAVSSVAQKPAVRSFMKNLTHDIAESCAKTGIVIEGRDITTVVYPDAPSRILLTASEAVRLKRRAKEIEGSGNVSAQVSERDAKDSKVVNFTEAAEGVTLLDSTELDFQQTVTAVEAQIAKDLSK